MRIGTPVVLSVCVAGFRLRVHGTLQIGPTGSSHPPWALTGRTRMKPVKAPLPYTIDWENPFSLLLGNADLMGRHPLSGGQPNLPVRPSEPRHMKDRGRRSKNKPRAGRCPRRWGALAQALRSLVAPLWRSKPRPQAAAKVLAPSASVCRPCHQPLRWQEPHYPALRHPTAHLVALLNAAG